MRIFVILSYFSKDLKQKDRKTFGFWDILKELIYNDIGVNKMLLLLFFPIYYLPGGRVGNSAHFLLSQFENEMCAVKETVEKGFAFIGRAKAATEIAHSIVVAQGQCMQKFFKFLKALADLRWIGFVGVRIGKVELIQNGSAIVTA